MKKNNKVMTLNNKDIYHIKSSKHFPSSIREWNNSIYVFNKSSINLIPSSTFSALKMIKSYFNSFNKQLEKKIRTRRLLLRLKRLSSNRIYLGNGEFKHTNNNVLINIYIYNRQKYNYLSKLKSVYIKNILKEKENKDFSTNIINKFSSINSKGIQCLKKIKNDKYLLIKGLNTIKNKNYKINNFKYLSFYTYKFYKNLLNKSLRKIKLYLFLKQLLFVNKSKLNYTYLQNLKKHLSNLYNKNVEFSVINLKRFYVNSDILSEVVRSKITRDRRTLLKTLNKVKNKIKIHKKSFFLGKIDKTNLDKNEYNHNELTNSIISDLKYRHITGFRLEAKGRLTRRYTASRSVHKFRYKGNLLDIDSSQRGLSSILLRGSLKSNIQYTKLKSKTRIGSFGIKGWISGN